MYYDDKFRFKGGGQIHNLELAMARSGWNSDLVEELAKGENPALVRDLLLQKLNSNMDFGATQWKRITDRMIIVNLDIPGHIPEDSKLEFAAFEHGLMVVDKRDEGLYINGSPMIVYEMEKRDYDEERLLRIIRSIAFHRFLPVQLRDALIDNPHLIPRDPGTFFFMHFFGTIYRGRDGHLFCPSLCWSDRSTNDKHGYSDLPSADEPWICDRSYHMNAI